jgi:hypothetical protein
LSNHGEAAKAISEAGVPQSHRRASDYARKTESRSTAQFVERDEAKHRAKMVANGSDAKGCFRDILTDALTKR